MNHMNEDHQNLDTRGQLSQIEISLVSHYLRQNCNRSTSGHAMNFTWYGTAKENAL